jgi:tetratricopeptide (TPR) repeat protein
MNTCSGTEVQIEPVDSDGITVPHEVPLMELPHIRHLLHWGQYDLALSSLRCALEHAERPEELFALYKTTGLVHAYLGAFNLSARAYTLAKDMAATAYERAETCVYLALLATKRQGEFEQAEAIIAEGFSHLANDSGERAMNERGWLANVLALTRFFQGRQDEALALCRSAYVGLKPFRSSDTLHLKINLVSNMSIVFEQQGLIEEALKVWRSFRPFLDGPGATLFGKIYYYREAGLLLRKGARDQATALYRRSFDEARRIRDVFHMVYIAYDLGTLAWGEERLDDAEYWFRQSLESARTCSDQARISLALETLDQLYAASTAAEAEFLPMPGTKLGRPFHLMHIPSLDTKN